jgi:hypothetical protein
MLDWKKFKIECIADHDGFRATVHREGKHGFFANVSFPDGGRSGPVSVKSLEAGMATAEAMIAAMIAKREAAK